MATTLKGSDKHECEYGNTLANNPNDRMSNPCRVDVGHSNFPGCAPRPWAMLCNRFAVKIGGLLTREYGRR